MHRYSVIAVAVAVALSAPAYSQVIEEVIVTAQKREESVMDVPISISAFSGDALEALGTRNLTDVGRFTAGVDMNNDKSLQPTYSVRGIETNDWTIGSDAAVAVYVDGVYAARGAGAEGALFDVERIEVLKGPQGTLFGRNATGGAIHIITPKPGPETEGRAKVTVGNYDRLDGEFLFNTALGPDVAIRVGASVRQRDGYLNNINSGDDFNEEDKLNLRLGLVWNPGDNTEILLRASYEEQDQNSGVLHSQNSTAWEAANPGRRHDDFGSVSYDFPEQLEKRDLFGASLELNHDFGDMTFTSITGWRDFETELLEDLDGSNNPEFYFGSSNPEKSDFFSQEFRLTGANDRVKWTVGAVYTYEDLEHTTEAKFLVTTFESFALKTDGTPEEEISALRAANRNGEDPFGTVLCLGLDCDGLATAVFIDSLTNGEIGLIPIFFAMQPRIQAGYDEPWNEQVDSAGEYSSYAVYADSTWTLNDKNNLTVGLRYTYDDKDFDLFTQYQNELLPGIPFGLAFFNGGQPLLDESQNDNWDAWSGRIVLDHHFNDDVMAYASVATGFKSGGFNSLNFGPGIETSYDEEEVINYELGIKGDVLDKSLRFATAVFFYEYDNLQTLELIGTPIPSYNLRNADAEGSGFEFEVAWLLGQNWMLAGNYSYLDTEFTSYAIIPAAGETEEDDLTGESRAQSPEHKYNVSLQYARPVEGVGEIVARADYTWSDDRINATRGEVGDYGLLNARISYFSPADHWELALWGRNLADEEMITFHGNGQAVGSTPGWRILPRTYGIDLIYTF